MVSSQLTSLLRLPPSLRTLLRPHHPIPTIRNLFTRSLKPPRTQHPHTSRPRLRIPFLHRFPRPHPLIWTAISILTWIPIAAFSINHIGAPMRVGGRSMYPFLNTDYASSPTEDRVWVSLWEPHRALKRGEIVVFWSPNNPERMAVKRIVALGGDKVQTRVPYPFAEETVPEGHVWVEGEHPEGSRGSLDSNTYGPIPVALLVGKVKAVYWPWEKAGWVRWQDYKGNPRVREGKVEAPMEIYTF